MSFIDAYLPTHDGLLPLWMLFVSFVSVVNSVQAYYSIHYTSRVYNGLSKASIKKLAFKSPVTPLSARTFGTWTLIQSLVRMYAAYNISEPAFYQLAFCTYAVAFGHFISEWLIYHTTSWGSGLCGPVLVSTGTMLWMALQWSYYVK